MSDDGEVRLLSGDGEELATGRLVLDRVNRSKSRDVLWTGDFESEADLASHIAPTSHPAPANSYILVWDDGRQVRVRIASHDGGTRTQINGIEAISAP